MVVNLSGGGPQVQRRCNSSKESRHGVGWTGALAEYEAF